MELLQMKWPLLTSVLRGSVVTNTEHLKKSVSLKCYYDQIWEFVFEYIFRKYMSKWLTVPSLESKYDLEVCLFARQFS